MTRPDVDDDVTPPPSAALVTATEAGLRTRRGWVFRDLDVAIRPDSVVAIVGEAGTGRTSALMVLAGLMAVTHGRVERTTSAVGVARLDEIAELEPRLSTEECVGERLLLSRVAPAPGRRALSRAVDLLDLPAPDRTPAEDLAPAHRTLFAVALALMAEPDVVVLDDLDAGLGSAAQSVVWNRMRDVARAGTSIVATAADAGPAAASTDRIATLHRPDRIGGPST